MCTFFLVVAFRDARFLSGLYGRFSYIVAPPRSSKIINNLYCVMLGVHVDGVVIVSFFGLDPALPRNVAECAWDGSPLSTVCKTLSRPS